MLFPALWRALISSLADPAWTLKGESQASEYFLPLNLTFICKYKGG